MNIIVFFTDAGEPKTGLSPTLDVWKLDGTQEVIAQNMTEVAGGFYFYDYEDYDEDEDYCIRADGGSSLSNSDRYLFSTNETAAVGNILKIEKNKWEITRDQLIFYDDDGTTALYTFDLKDNRGSPSSRNVFSRTPA